MGLNGSQPGPGARRGTGQAIDDLLELAAEYAAAEQFADADRLLADVLDLRPTHAEALFGLGLEDLRALAHRGRPVPSPCPNGLTLWLPARPVPLRRVPPSLRSARLAMAPTAIVSIRNGPTSPLSTSSTSPSSWPRSSLARVPTPS